MKCLIGTGCPNIESNEMLNHLKVEHHFYIKDNGTKDLFKLILMRLEEHEEQIRLMKEEMSDITF